MGIGTSQHSAQSKEEETCSEPIYYSKEVTHKAKITRVIEPQYTEKARANGVTGKVILKAVFCQTGKVTNVEVVQGLPHGLTENAVETPRRIKFKPAEKDGETVSQYFTRECAFSLS